MSDDDSTDRGFVALFEILSRRDPKDSTHFLNSFLVDDNIALVMIQPTRNVTPTNPKEKRYCDLSPFRKENKCYKLPKEPSQLNRIPRIIINFLYSCWVGFLYQCPHSVESIGYNGPFTVYSTRYTAFALEDMLKIQWAILRGENEVNIVHVSKKDPEYIVRYTIVISSKQVMSSRHTHHLLFNPDFSSFVG